MGKEVVKLRDYNKETYKKVVELFEIYKRVSVVQATGTGKTYLAMKLVEDNIDKKICILSPSRYINNQFKEAFPDLSNKIDFYTYQKIIKFDEEKTLNFKYDIIILDEFHRLGAQVWGQRINQILSNNFNSKIFGMTATKKRFSDNEKDMVEELFYGVCANEMDLFDSIKKGILKKPKFVSAICNTNIDKDKVERKIEKSGLTDEEKIKLINKTNHAFKAFSQRHGMVDILKKYITNQRKIIIFCESLKHLNAVKSDVEQWFIDGFGENVTTYEIHSFEKKSNYMLKNFELGIESGFHLLFCINKLNEGVHIKDVSCAMFLRNTLSPTIFYQQIGRVITADSEQEPLIFDLVNNSLNILKGTGRTYSCYWGDNDEVEKEVFHGEFEIIDETREFLSVIEEIDSIINSDWDEMFEELIKYYKEHGNFYISRSNFKLNRWARRQRENRKKMPKDRFDKLNNIGFVWNELEDKWMKNYARLGEFYKKHGHSDVKRSHGDAKLYEWVKSQRDRRAQDTLSPKRIVMLEKYNLNWRYQDELFEKLWEEKYSKLLDYKKEHGDVLVKRGYEDQELSNWVSTQRKRYKAGKMTEERIKRLEAIGFSWKVPYGKRKKGE